MDPLLYSRLLDLDAWSVFATAPGRPSLATASVTPVACSVG